MENKIQVLVIYHKNCMDGLAAAFIADVSVVAKSFGGGGHRNACGCSFELNEFVELLNGSIIDYADAKRLV